MDNCVNFNSANSLKAYITFCQLNTRSLSLLLILFVRSLPFLVTNETGSNESKKELTSSGTKLSKFQNEFPLLQIRNGQEIEQNIEVQFNVDATRLELDEEKNLAKGKFTDLIMNFPHYGSLVCFILIFDSKFIGGKTNLKKARELLQKIFYSVSRHLMIPEYTRFHLTFAQGQSGISSDSIRSHHFFGVNPPNYNKDSWQPIKLAAECGLRVEKVEEFRIEYFKGCCILYFSQNFKTKFLLVLKNSNFKNLFYI